VPKLILASASPRRAELLRQAGFDFEVHAADVDETAPARRNLPAALALLLAVTKAQGVAPRFPGDVTLAADTVVAFGDIPLGKPADEAEARDMIRLLAGATHVVITAVAVHRPSKSLSVAETVMSAVRMRPLTPVELDRYVASGLWQGKAGGYGIQDPEPIVTCTGGSVSNVIGLPMARTRALLQRAGIQPKP